MALACPPPAPAFEEAARRGYMGGPGSCPNGYRPIMKRIMAVAGDVVTFDGTGGAMRVNGEEIPNSARQPRDAAGRSLSPWAGGPIPIGVKLASYGIADIRLSFASGMGEASMHVGGGLQEVMESDAADDGDQQHTSGDVPHAPERRGISSVEQVLRGRRPGNPGRGRRTTRPG
jgi:hypothetical protein